MNENDLINLIEKFEQGECNLEEIAILESWYISYSARQQFPDIELHLSERQLRTWNNIVHRRRKISYLPYLRYAAAALIVIGVASTLYFLSFDKKAAIAKDIQPGSNKATLTLADGQQISLDDAKAGVIANQSGVSVSKNKNGQIVYDVSNTSPTGANAFNTITTPNGGQYQVILPDGSKVWLNAATSLKYPIKFNSTERRVEISGEGYFEIAKNPATPFIVSSASQIVKVLGTHFNLSTYAGEPTRTTLAEGSISITLTKGMKPSDSQKTILSPGDESTVTGTGLSIAKVDPEGAIAWKDGLFIFSNTDLKSVLRQVARWYDVDVDYNAIPDMKYYGELPRELSLLKVLELIETGSNVPLKLEGRRIMHK